MMKKILFAALFSVSMTVQAGPFGLEMGMSLEEMQSKMPLEQGANEYSYKTLNVPISNSQFQSYRLFTTPKTGLCKVVAWTGIIPSDSFGTNIIRDFDSIYDSMTSKYGKGDVYKHLLRTSKFTSPNEWVMSLLNKDRVQAVLWKFHNTIAPDNISSIVLEAHAISPQTAAISLSYEFINTETCSETLTKKNSEGL